MLAAVVASSRPSGFRQENDGSWILTKREQESAGAGDKRLSLVRTPYIPMLAPPPGP